MTLSYDPEEHARELGVDIVWGHPGVGILGRYDHDTRTIVLEPSMSSRQTRSVLAHELIHAEREDEHNAIDSFESTKRENYCDLKAAENLIDRADLLTIAAMYPSDLPKVAYELGVMPDLLTIYLRKHPLPRGDEDFS